MSQNVNSGDSWVMLWTSSFFLFAPSLHFNLDQRGGLSTQLSGKPCTQRARGREDDIRLPSNVTGIMDVILLCSYAVSINPDNGEVLESGGTYLESELCHLTSRVTQDTSLNLPASDSLSVTWDKRYLLHGMVMRFNISFWALFIQGMNILKEQMHSWEQRILPTFTKRTPSPATLSHCQVRLHWTIKFMVRWIYSGHHCKD